ncbi:hypothetical protein BDZ89DRAFT_966175, partial [Hymenopellis radicata]
YLISGTDVSPDASPELLKELYDVQLMVLRRLLGVNNRSMIAPLFTELGLIPLPYR